MATNTEHQNLHQPNDAEPLKEIDLQPVTDDQLKAQASKNDAKEDEDEFPSGPCCFTMVTDFKNFWLEFFESLAAVWAIILEERNKVGQNAVREFIMDRFPPLRWVPQYTGYKLYRDLVAGLVVGCTLIPQAISYASVAQLPPVNGLYTGFAPLIVYTFFGTSRQMGVGPVTIVSTLIGQGTPACWKVCYPKKVPANYTVIDPYPNCPSSCNATSANPTLNWNPNYQYMTSAVALACGIIFLVAAPLLGWILNFVPHPVIVGFTSGGGFIIALGQLKYIQGYTIRKDNLQVGIYDFFANIKQTQGTTATMGWLAIAFIFFWRKLSQGRVLWWKVKSIPEWVKQVALLPWAFALIILYTGVAAIYNLSSKGVTVVGTIPPGLPTVVVPPNFSSNLPQLVSLIGAVTIVGYLESISVETKFANLFKYQINPTQEAFAQGWANVIGGITQCYPAIGSFSRSAINAAYGSQSPFCNFVAAMVVMVTLLTLTQTLYTMPQCGLAAIVIVAGLGLVEWPEFVYLFRTNWKDFGYIVITFCCTCFSQLETGIYVAVCLCAFEVMFKATRPKITVVDNNVIMIYLPSSTLSASSGFELQETSVPDLTKYLTNVPSDVLVCRIEGELNFAATNHVKKVINTKFPEIYKERSIRKFVFETSETTLSDSTAVNSIVVMIESIQAHDIAVCFASPPKGINIFLKHKHIKRKFKHVPLFKNMRELEKSGWLTEATGDSESNAVPTADDAERGLIVPTTEVSASNAGLVHLATPAALTAETPAQNWHPVGDVQFRGNA